MPSLAAPTKADILHILEQVTDPEVPVINVRELGVLRDVNVEEERVVVTITPTYTGCPAMDAIKQDIEAALHAAGIAHVQVKQVLAPAWSTDEITEEGRRKLKEYGIAPPPRTADIRALRGAAPIVQCPHCGSTDTVMVSLFGSTACKALWKCNDCLEPFDQFKCL